MAVTLEMSDDQRAELSRIARSQTEPVRKVTQARVILALAGGSSLRQVERELGPTSKTILAWRDIFVARGVEGLGVIGRGRGRKPVIGADVLEAIVHDTLHTVPDDESECWSTRTLGVRHGVGKDIVAALWRKRRLRPWRRDTFKLSNDPNFEAKLVDVVGVYMDPPVNAAVFCFDEKTQIQALDRTQPSLPMIPGRAGTLTHDYKRHGTIDYSKLSTWPPARSCTISRLVTPGATCCPSSNGSMRTFRVNSTCTSCWTTFPRTHRNPCVSGSPCPHKLGGICTSRRRRHRG